MSNQKQTAIIRFQFEENNVRTHLDEFDTPWFIAKDVCDILDIKDVSQAVENLEEDEKLLRKIHGAGQQREMLLINESGLYALIFRSNKPGAKAFRQWVTSEVLPEIRQTGGYHAGRLKLDNRTALELMKLVSKGNEYAEAVLRENGFRKINEKTEQMNLFENEK